MKQIAVVVLLAFMAQTFAAKKNDPVFFFGDEAQNDPVFFFGDDGDPDRHPYVVSYARGWEGYSGVKTLGIIVGTSDKIPKNYVGLYTFFNPNKYLKDKLCQKRPFSSKIGSKIHNFSKMSSNFSLDS